MLLHTEITYVQWQILLNISADLFMDEFFKWSCNMKEAGGGGGRVAGISLQALNFVGSNFPRTCIKSYGFSSFERSHRLSSLWYFDPNVPDQMTLRELKSPWGGVRYWEVLGLFTFRQGIIPC